MILTISNVAIFVLVLLIGEIRHRSVLRRFVPFKQPFEIRNSMTKAEFN